MISDQVDRLKGLGLADLLGISEKKLSSYGNSLSDKPGSTVAIHPMLATARVLAPLLSRAQKQGFVVGDLNDLELFVPLHDIEIPDSPLYLLLDIERGDDMRNWSPKEALPAIAGRGRTPLTINEGISWLLQEPTMLEPNHCFMTIGSRKPKPKGLDARTPALWISGGAGHDGKENSGAPKVGWCWAGNRHTWLGFASASARST